MFARQHMVDAGLGEGVGVGVACADPPLTQPLPKRRVSRRANDHG
jgi:hypothetical protein